MNRLAAVLGGTLLVAACTLDPGDDFPDFLLLNSCDVPLVLTNLSKRQLVIDLEPGEEREIHPSRPGAVRFLVALPSGATFEIEGSSPLTISKESCEAAG